MGPGTWPLYAQTASGRPSNIGTVAGAAVSSYSRTPPASRTSVGYAPRNSLVARYAARSVGSVGTRSHAGRLASRPSSSRVATRCMRSELDRPQPQRIRDHRDGAQAHRRRGDHRAQRDTEDGIERARRDRHTERVVDECEKEILANVPHDHARETTR